MPLRARLSRLLLSSCLLFPLAAFARTPLDGAWQLESGEYIGADGARIDYTSAGINGTKVLGEGHFAFTTTKAGTFWAGGAGIYSADGRHYAETPQMASYPTVDGGTYRFTYTLEGDRWTLERHEDGRRVEREVWRRATAP